MKIMRKLVLVPLEEWEKIKPQQQSRQRGEDKKSISVPQMVLKSPKKEEKWSNPPAAAAAAAAAAEQTSLPVKKENRKKRKKERSLTEEMKEEKSLKKIKEDIKEEKFPNNKVSQPILRIEHFSPAQRKNAAKLLKYLRKSKKVAYNDKLEIIYNKKVLENTNIVNLIEHALSRRNRLPIPGMTRFYRILRNVKVPIEFVKNPLGKIIMNKKSEL